MGHAGFRLYPNKMPVTAVHLLNNDVLPTFEARSADIEWQDVAMRDGAFSTADESLEGHFYGPNHEEAGGAFDQDGMAGVLFSQAGIVEEDGQIIELDSRHRRIEDVLLRIDIAARLRSRRDGREGGTTVSCFAECCSARSLDADRRGNPLISLHWGATRRLSTGKKQCCIGTLAPKAGR